MSFPVAVQPLNYGLPCAYLVTEYRWLRWGKMVVDRPRRLAFVMLDGPLSVDAFVKIRATPAPVGRVGTPSELLL